MCICVNDNINFQTCLHPVTVQLIGRPSTICAFKWSIRALPSQHWHSHKNCTFCSVTRHPDSDIKRTICRLFFKWSWNASYQQNACSQTASTMWFSLMEFVMQNTTPRCLNWLPMKVTSKHLRVTFTHTSHSHVATNMLVEVSSAAKPDKVMLICSARCTKL